MCWEGNGGEGWVNLHYTPYNAEKYCIIENGVLLWWCGEGVGVWVSYLK